MGALQAIGEYSGKVIDAAIVDSNFKDDELAMQAMVKMETPEGDTATWYGTLSSSIVQQGGNAGKSWLEITKGTLDYLGVKDLHLTRIKGCIGKDVSWVMKEKDGRYSVSYIVTGHKKLNDTEVKSRLDKILGDVEMSPDKSPGESPGESSGDVFDKAIESKANEEDLDFLK